MWKNVPCSSEMCCAHLHDICEANVNTHMMWLSLWGYMQKLWYYKWNLGEYMQKPM